MKYHLCVVWDDRETRDTYINRDTPVEACQALAKQPDVAIAIVITDDFEIHCAYVRNVK